jgi:hypothetical protein
MVGTMMQDSYGWVMDDAGDPELYVWHGQVVVGWMLGSIGDADLSSRLYKIVFNRNAEGNHDGTIGFSLVKDLTSSYPHTSTKWNANLTFISRDVFLLTENNVQQADTYAQPVRTYVWANKLNSAGDDVTTKIWNRKLIKAGQTDPEVSGGNSDNWPGLVVGFSYVPPESEYYDTVRKNGSVIALTTCMPYQGPYVWIDDDDPDLGGDPKNQILKLDTDDANINNNYYEDTDSFKAGADVGSGESSTTSAWDLVKQIGNGIDQLDSQEGWCALDSKGSLYYGNALFYFSDEAGGENLMETDEDWDYGDWDSVHNNDGHFFRHSILRISSPLSGGINNRTVMHFNNTLYNSNIWDGGYSAWTFDLRNFLEADGGCFDIYGQTVHGKDSLWLLVDRNGRRKDGSTAAGTFNSKREGLWVLKDNGGDNKFDVLQHYAFDNTYPFDHATTPDQGSTRWVTSSGMSFRPAAKR